MVFRKEIRVLCFLLIILTYNLFINYSLDLSLNKGIVNLLFWLILGAVFFTFGKVRSHGKIKYKGYYFVWMFTAGVIYILSYFSSGFLDGFGKTLYDTSLSGIATNIVLLGSVIVLKEWIRFCMINSVQKKFVAYFSIGIVLIYSLFEINLVTVSQLDSLESVVSYLCATVLPVIAKHAFLTLISYLAGFRSAIIYALVINIPLWILPVLPSPKWITMLLVGTMIPIIGMVVLSNTNKSHKQRGKKRKEDEENPYGLLLTAVIVVGIVWFALRIFPLYPTVIASNSMYPEINRGDMVIAMKESYDELEIDDIIEYQLEDIRIVHRIVDMKYIDGDTYLITKGDANNIEDSFMVSRQQYLGTIRTSVPYLGYPALFFNTEPEQHYVETGDALN